MTQRKFLGFVAITSLAWFVGCTGNKPPPTTKEPSTKTVDNLQDYWTCSMHPQVHQNGPGKCPICGMDLIHVHGNQKLQKKEPEAIAVLNSQLQNAQISKYNVTRKDLEISIPVSGRIVSSREVAFQVYETELESVKAGFEFRGMPSGNPGQTLTGQITRVDTLVDPSSRTLRAIGLINSSSINLAAESGFNGEIIHTLRNQIVIPEDSVLHGGARDLVYVFTSDNQLQAREVQIGAKGKDQFQILSGLKQGEIISSGPNFLIDSEAKIRGQ